MTLFCISAGKGSLVQGSGALFLVCPLFEPSLGVASLCKTPSQLISWLQEPWYTNRLMAVSLELATAPAFVWLSMLLSSRKQTFSLQKLLFPFTNSEFCTTNFVTMLYNAAFF
jgi:hypothetical protein